MNYKVFSDKAIKEVANLLDSNNVTNSQRNYANKLVARYLEFVKSDKSAESLVDVVRDFLNASKAKDKNKVRNAFISITRVKKESEKEVTLRKKGSTKGACKLSYEYIGRSRICGPSEWANKINRELKRRAK